MTPNSVKHLYLIINIANVYIKESNGNKYLALVATDESKHKLKKYEEIQIKKEDLIRSENNNSYYYDENIEKSSSIHMMVSL